MKTGWDGKTYTTTAAADGKWKLAVETPVAGGPYDLTISDGQPLTLKNVLIGEVWVCSGQSNMEMPMKGFKMQPVEGANMDAAYSRNPRIRLFTVGLNSQTTPQDTVKGHWSEACAESVREFSATAYYFGRMLNRVLDGVPVGLIVTAWGGSACEAWMNPAWLKPEWMKNYKYPVPAPGGKIPSKNRTATVLYNGMLHPLIGYTMRGVIWYQGEDNYDRAWSYADQLSTMVRGWRTEWGQGDFPFYFCQIAPYDYSLLFKEGEEVPNSAFLREQQAKAAELIPNSGMAVLLVDTVGFVSRLPHNLVEAFKSTLEEAAWSDVIVRVADAGDEQREEQLSVTDEVLDGLDCADIPRLTVYNKCDKPNTLSFDPDILLTSAKTGYGLDKLLQKLDEVLSDRVHTIRVLLPYDKLGLAAPMRERGSVQVEEYREDGLYLEGIVKTEDLHCFEGYLV